MPPQSLELPQPEPRDWFEFFCQNYQKMHRIATFICGCEERAADLVQDTMVRILTMQQARKETILSSAWAAGVLRKVALEEFKRFKRNQSQSLGSADEVEEEMTLTSDLEQQRIDAQMDWPVVLNLLDANELAILKLRYCEGMTYAQIAEHLGLTLEAVAKRCSRILSRLRARLEPPPIAPKALRTTPIGSNHREWR